MLERINGNEKGDAIVSVRGYEPIWSRFTPSYELKGVYFKEGKASVGKREAVLFEKENYVFDITGRSGVSDADKILEIIEADEEKENAEEIAEQKRLAELDKKWQSIADEIDFNLKEFIFLLKGKDAKAIREASFGNKVTLLYAIMDEYDYDTAEKIQIKADYVAKRLAEMRQLQDQATK